MVVETGQADCLLAAGGAGCSILVTLATAAAARVTRPNAGRAHSSCNNSSVLIHPRYGAAGGAALSRAPRPVLPLRPLPRVQQQPAAVRQLCAEEGIAVAEQ